MTASRIRRAASMASVVAQMARRQRFMAAATHAARSGDRRGSDRAMRSASLLARTCEAAERRLCSAQEPWQEVSPQCPTQACHSGSASGPRGVRAPQRTNQGRTSESGGHVRNYELALVA